MPPSPALRFSPGREPRAVNHKRGSSLEGGLLFGEKDDDLTLFNEMQTRERDNFLVQPIDDFEDTFSTKLRYFSDYKLGISIPVRGENSDMLNAEGEKNDYDWLLTPPDTPLFASLDDEPPPANVARRGRPRSQPISISRSSTMEKSYRSSRGSASPNRLSPSPRSGSSTFQSRGRPSSAYSSPPPSQQHAIATPSRRPSPPSSKPSTPPSRSSTPTPRRVSTGSSGSVPTSGVRGISPVKTSRGNSASPKIRAWQSNIPGFSSDAPPNLRTSLADRPASYVRGSSPASRASRDSTSKHGRQSMSPTASRSVSSSHSHDRDRFSSHSKGSVVSSGDDDLDSPQSISIGNSDSTASKQVSAYPNNRSLAFSKKSARILSSSSAPKRYFDSALRQMDHRKSPQNMFRPLLSSVPSTSFYVGKASAQRSMISRNSSVTTSSNASSDHGTIVARDTEGNAPNQEDVASEYEKVPDPVQEVSAFDKMDSINEEVGQRSLNIRHGDLDRGLTIQCGDSDDYSHHGRVMEMSATSENVHVKDDFSEVDSLESTAICSKCGFRYHVIDPLEGDDKLCPECGRKGNLLSVIVTEISENSQVPSTKISEEYKAFGVLEPVIAVPRLPEVNDTGEPRVCKGEETVVQGQSPDVKQGQNHLHANSLGRTLVEGGEQVLSNRKEMSQPTVGCCLSDGDTGRQQYQQSSDYPNLKVDVSEGAGISVLLKRSSSSKGFLVQSRTFTASTVPYNDLSYARDSTNSIRSSIGHGSVSASSSVDFSSARQTESRVQRQLSGKKSDMENYRYDINHKPQGNGTSFSGNSNHSYHAFGVAISTHEGNFEVPVASQELVLQQVDVTNTAITRAAILEEGNFECDGNNRTIDASTSELSSHVVSIQLDDNSVASFPNCEDSVSYENGTGSTNNVRSISDMEASTTTLESSVEEEHPMLNTSVDGSDVADIPPHSSLVTRSEIEIENCMQSTSGSQIGDISLQLKSIVNELQESSVPTPEKNLSVSVSEPNDSDHRRSFTEESTVILEGREGGKARSLSLEEATDTILFCSSIVHDLAYEAATIAMEKESSVPWEGSRPTVTIPGKFSSDRKEPRGRTVGRRASKSQKAMQRWVETDTEPPSSKPENGENIDHQSPATRIVGLPNKEDSMKAPPKLESKCNCTIM